MLKRQAGYTTTSSVVKQLSLAHLQTSDISEAKPLMDNHLVTVFPSVFANDGTALKVPRNRKLFLFSFKGYLK